MKIINETKLSNMYTRNFLYILFTGTFVLFYIYYEHFTVTSSIVILLVILFIGWIIKKYIFYTRNYKESLAYSLLRFPIEMTATIFTLFAIAKIAYDTLESKRQIDRLEAQNLSNYTHTTVIDNWENKAMKYPELNTLYESVFCKQLGNTNTFLTKTQWESLGLNIPYIPFEGNENKYHYAAINIQSMVNIVRMHALVEKFKVNNDEDLKKSTSSKFAGWFTVFRMWMSTPLCRNVWEQYKYRHVNPEFSAWVEYFVIQPVENPEYWLNHRTNWDNEAQDILKTYKNNSEKLNNISQPQKKVEESSQIDGFSSIYNSAPYSSQ